MVLLTLLKKQKEKEKEVRILMLGLDNAGKTTVWKKLTGQDVTTISPTLGFHIQTLDHNGYNLTIWDVGGQKSLRSYWKNYFDSKTDGLIWVVDSADKMRMNDCKEEFDKLIKDEKLSSVTVLILANKADLPGAMSCEEIRDVLGLQKIKTHHWNILSCSAIKGDNLLPGLDWITQDISSRLYMFD